MCPVGRSVGAGRGLRPVGIFSNAIISKAESSWPNKYRFGRDRPQAQNLISKLLRGPAPAGYFTILMAVFQYHLGILHFNLDFESFMAGAGRAPRPPAPNRFRCNSKLPFRLCSPTIVPGKNISSTGVEFIIGLSSSRLRFMRHKSSGTARGERASVKSVPPVETLR
ncbi:hypothetical protein EVAR_4794_1 [Eumeta japonica]|uniref:Uncharacterized protein n=1 Tax=Eumeta variegata TaxID=151549 RepID=A0A4C1SZM9_EUMVA|nr:hypothetical protein EVAR_4794_1 [Eumeta japonica]